VTRRILLALGCVLALTTGLFACGAEDPPDLRMQVRWSLTDPSAPLPEEVDQLSLEVFVGDSTEGDAAFFTVSNLEDRDADGRPELLREALPTGEPIRMRVTGLSGGLPVYVGHAGPFVLRAGERRYLAPAMFRLDGSTQVERASITPRILPTGTSLPDGRVLVSGGFDSVVPSACPDGTMEGSRCFSLEAAQDAWVFDPTTGRFAEVQGGLLRARGGHTATSLPDGRVLLAGGASRATLVMRAQGMPATGFSVAFVPDATEAASGAGATFELFDPELNAELDDVDADGDPGRGGFLGAADDITRPGRLDRARFLASAASIPGTAQVLIAGGADDASATFALFDARRPGGYGVIEVGASGLAAPRALPGAVGVGTSASPAVWLFGGGAATSDADLAEVWTPGATAAAGTFASASAAPLSFPRQSPSVEVSHPEWSLTAPLVERLDSSHVVVMGWFGPRCAQGVSPMMATARFEDGMTPTEACPFSRTQLRSFTVDVTTGLASPTLLRNPHAFGASARLDDGRIVVTGGITSLSWETNNTIDVLRGTVSADGSAALDPATPVLRIKRAMHVTVPLPDGGALSVGGLSWSADLSSTVLAAQPEVLYLSPAS